MNLSTIDLSNQMWKPLRLLAIVAVCGRDAQTLIKHCVMNFSLLSSWASLQKMANMCKCPDFKPFILNGVYNFPCCSNYEWLQLGLWASHLVSGGRTKDLHPGWKALSSALSLWPSILTFGWLVFLYETPCGFASCRLPGSALILLRHSFCSTSMSSVIRELNSFYAVARWPRHCPVHAKSSKLSWNFLNFSC